VLGRDLRPPWKSGLYVHETVTYEGADFALGQADLLHCLKDIPQGAIGLKSF
jgi:hypothetical protein